jgi:hypothetical protein
MAALIQERLTKFAGVVPARGTYPIAANTRIFKGSLVVLNSSGQAIPGNTAANGAAIAVGKASHTLNNLTGSELGGAAGAADIEVEYGVFQWETAGGADLIEADDVGKLAYVVDDQTVAIVATGRVAAGCITEVREGKPYVWMGPHVFPLTA